MNRSFLILVLSILFLCGSTLALRGEPRGTRGGVRRHLKEDGEDKAKKEPKDDKKGKKDSKKEKKKKCKKAKKDPKEARKDEIAGDGSEFEDKGDAGVEEYCEDDHCAAINEGYVLDSKNKVSGTISLKVAHSQTDQDRLVSKIGRILQNETSARIAGCFDDKGDDEVVPTDLSVSRAEGTQGKKILQANFYNMQVEDKNVRCKSRSADKCDTLTTNLDVIYESSDGSRATEEDAEEMMRSVEEAIQEQEDDGIFKGVAASVESVSTKYSAESFGSERPDAETAKKGGFSPGIAIGVVVAGIGCLLAAIGYNKMQNRTRDLGEPEEKEGGGWVSSVLAMPDNIRRSSS